MSEISELKHVVSVTLTEQRCPTYLQSEHPFCRQVIRSDCLGSICVYTLIELSEGHWLSFQRLELNVIAFRWTEELALHKRILKILYEVCVRRGFEFNVGKTVFGSSGRKANAHKETKNGALPV